MVATALVGSVLAACGSDGRTEPSQTAKPGGSLAIAGKEVFGQRCASCHTLSDAGATGSVGPNLDELKPDAQGVERKVQRGGGGMPAFEGDLDEEQIRAVSEYVAGVAGR